MLHLIRYEIRVILLDTYLLARQDVRTKLDLAKGALSQRLHQYIVANSMRLLWWTGLPGRPVPSGMASARLSSGLPLCASFLLVGVVASATVALAIVLLPMPGTVQIV